jgi:cytochrome c oxidase accessory protein FixG
MGISNYFEAKKRLYPQAARGFFRRTKWLLNLVFLAIYLLSPFLRFDRGAGLPNQAILIDMEAGKGYFFAIEMWPNEVFYLMGILLLAAISLFFVTSLFGRIWCGYACFQTVWTDIFIAVEKIFQGDRNARIILDRKNSFEKYFKKLLTHITWIAIGLITGFAFTNYFHDAFLQIQNLIKLNLDFATIGWSAGIAFATYIMAGFAREHVCTFMCPYARFQSAMFDRDTLIIAYDEKRGEPRGKLKSKDFSLEPETHQGDCIDCKQCVVVCPTGIDIRNGLQMECIACGLCIDACDEVMEKINRPKGLIRYDTQKNIETGQQKPKILRPRSFFYLFILTAICGFLLYSLLNKAEVETRMIADRNPAFVTLSNGSIRNGYELKISNKTNIEKEFLLKAISPSHIKIKVNFYDENEALRIKPNKVNDFKIYATISENEIQRLTNKEILINLELIDIKSGEIIPLSAIFITP